jgi:hypothetical protein
MGCMMSRAYLQTTSSKTLDRDHEIVRRASRKSTIVDPAPEHAISPEPPRTIDLEYSAEIAAAIEEDERGRRGAEIALKPSVPKQAPFSYFTAGGLGT